MFEAAVGTAASARPCPRELAKEVLREAARDVFEPVLAAASETAGEARRPRRARRSASPDDARASEQPRQPGASAPALRAAATSWSPSGGGSRPRQMRLLKAQVGVRRRWPRTRAARAAADTARGSPAATDSLNEMEETSHSADGDLQEADGALRRTPRRAAPRCAIVIDADWRVVRAHITAPNGRQARRPAAPEHSGWFPLDALHLARHVTWEPAELAWCEALLDGRGGVVRTRPQREGRRATSTSSSSGCAREGLPRTRVLTGD